MAPSTSSTSSPLLLLLLAFALSAFGSGCSLIWEPPDEAANRLVEAAATRDRAEIDELVEDDGLRATMNDLSVYLSGPKYRGKSGYWRISDVTEDEPNDRTYVTVVLDVPQPTRRTRRGSRASRTREMEMVFEMQRRNLRWYVLSIDGIDTVLNMLRR